MRKYIVRFEEINSDKNFVTKVFKQTFAEAEAEANRIRHGGFLEGSAHNWRIVSIVELPSQ